MHITEKGDFLNAFRGVAEGYGKTFSTSVGEMYWHALNFFNLEAIKEAAIAHQGDETCGAHMPLPADIIHHIKESAESEATRTWRHVVRAIRHLGAYQTVVFDNAVIHAAIADMGGWIKLCQTKEENLERKGAVFEKHYVFYTLHPPEYFPPALIGICDKANKLYSFESGNPTFVGDIHKAKAVYLMGEIYASFFCDEYAYDPMNFAEPNNSPSQDHKTIH